MILFIMWSSFFAEVLEHAFMIDVEQKNSLLDVLSFVITIIIIFYDGVEQEKTHSVSSKDNNCHRILKVTRNLASHAITYNIK